MKDVLTPEERRVVEDARYNSFPSVGVLLTVMEILDRVAPKPKEFTWCEGYHDFVAACKVLFSGDTRNFVSTIKDPLSQHNEPEEIAAAAYWRLIKVNDQNKLEVTSKGKAFLKDAEEWEKSNETQG